MAECVNCGEEDDIMMFVEGEGHFCEDCIDEADEDVDVESFFG